MKKLLAVALIIAIAALQANAQGGPRRGGKFRALQGMEARFGLGMSNVLGELGGANRIGTNFFRDYEIVMTRPAAYLGVRYYIPESRWAGTFNILYARVSGRDNLTTEQFRSNRNLNFRSPIVELSLQVEYYFRKRQSGARYNIREVVGAKQVNMDWYLFAGFGGFFFNPKGQYNGTWYALQPFGTEGQGMVATRNKYRRFAACIPYGVGGKYGIDQNISVGFEIGFRYAFTDYLDDVSTTYVENNLLVINEGLLAAELADPSLGLVPGQTAAGEQRGDPRDKDAYMFFMFNVNYKIAGQGGRLPKFFSWAIRF